MIVPSEFTSHEFCYYKGAVGIYKVYNGSNVEVAELALNILKLL